MSTYCIFRDNLRQKRIESVMLLNRLQIWERKYFSKQQFRAMPCN